LCVPGDALPCAYEVLARAAARAEPRPLVRPAADGVTGEGRIELSGAVLESLRRLLGLGSLLTGADFLLELAPRNDGARWLPLLAAHGLDALDLTTRSVPGELQVRLSW
jgi:hypothetical protein